VRSSAALSEPGDEEWAPLPPASANGAESARAALA